MLSILTGIFLTSSTSSKHPTSRWQPSRCNSHKYLLLSRCGALTSGQHCKLVLCYTLYYLDTVLLSQTFVLVATPSQAPHSKPFSSTAHPTAKTHGLAPLDVMDALLASHWQTLLALTTIMLLPLTMPWNKFPSTTTFHAGGTAYRIWLRNASFATIWLKRRNTPQQSALFSRNLVLKLRSSRPRTTATNPLHVLPLRVLPLPRLPLPPPLPRPLTLGGVQLTSQELAWLVLRLRLTTWGMNLTMRGNVNVRVHSMRVVLNLAKPFHFTLLIHIHVPTLLPRSSASQLPLTHPPFAQTLLAWLSTPKVPPQYASLNTPWHF